MAELTTILQEYVATALNPAYNGNWDIIDTNKKHTAVNASWDDRIHIIGNLHDKTY